MHKENITDIVRRNLWSRGYRVKTFSDTELGFDLLVEGKFKVLVIEDDGKDRCRTGADADVRFDTIALVSFDMVKRPVIRYTGAEGPTINPGSVFGLSKNKTKDTYVKGKKGDEKSRKKEGSKKEGSR